MEHKPYILPVPQDFSYAPEITFALHRCRHIVLCISACGCARQSSSLFNHARLLQKSVKEMTGIQIPVITGTCDPDKVSNNLPHSHWDGGDIFLMTDAQLDAHSHCLTIDHDRIVIKGHEPVDVLYAIQSLRQLISQQGALLHGVRITDYPALLHRGFYHDATRGRIPDLKALKKLADRCSYYKINELQFYVEHSYLFKGCSEIWRDETPLTAEEIMEFDSYCQNLGIDLIPSISTFGHLYKMLETKTFSPLCELEDAGGHPFSFANRMAHHTLDASNPQTLELIKDRIDEYMSLFSSRYFNICADETFDIGCGRTKELVETLGKEEVYIRFIKVLCDHVAARGKIPMFWGDIIVSAPEKTAVLPKETICLNWGYAPNQDDRSVKAFQSAGVKQYLCPGVQGWNSLINLMPDAYENISRMCSYAFKYNAQGILNTDWGDMGHPNHPDFSAFGLILGAALSWNRDTLSFEDACRQVSVLEYRDTSETVMTLISQLSTKAVMNWTTAVLFKENTQGYFKGSAFEQYYGSQIEKMLERATPEKIRQINSEIDELSDRLSACLIHVPEKVKYTINCFLNGAQGQRILNRIAQHIYEVQKASPSCTACASQNQENSRAARHQTAVDLETWFMDYKDIWRSQGKEADLYRIQNVINWYGDWLREQ